MIVFSQLELKLKLIFGHVVFAEYFYVEIIETSLIILQSYTTHLNRATVKKRSF